MTARVKSAMMKGTTSIQTVAELEKQHPRVYRDKRGSYVLGPDGVERLPTERRGVLTAEEWIDADAAVARAVDFRTRATRFIAASGLLLDISKMPDDMMAGFDPTWKDIPPVGQRPFIIYDIRVDLDRIERDRELMEVGIPGGSSGCFDATLIEAAARRVGEAIEYRTLTAITEAATTEVAVKNPTWSGWTPQQLVRDTLDIIEKFRVRNLFSNLTAVFHGREWDMHLDNDYVVGDMAAQQTVRDRLRQIGGIADVRAADHVSGFGLLAVYLGASIIRIISGLPPKLYQWDDDGGFKVVAQVFPQIRNPDGLVRGVCK